MRTWICITILSMMALFIGCTTLSDPESQCEIVTFQTGDSTGILTGVVVELLSDDPIVGCEISVKDIGLCVTTDTNGVFFLQDMPEGEYEVKAKLLGYKEMSAIARIDGEQHQHIIFYMMEMVLKGEGEIGCRHRNPIVRDEIGTVRHPVIKYPIYR